MSTQSSIPKVRSGTSGEVGHWSDFGEGSWEESDSPSPGFSLVSCSLAASHHGKAGKAAFHEGEWGPLLHLPCLEPPSHTYTSELLILVLPSSYGPSSRSNRASSSPCQLPALEVMATCVALSAERKKSPLLLLHG